MAALLNWIAQNTIRVLDPDRTARVDTAAAQLERLLAEQRKEFRLDDAVQRLEIYREEIPLVTANVFKSLLGRAWRDATITEGERKTLSWAGNALAISPEQQRKLEHEVALDAFERVLAAAMADGTISTHEVEHLKHIASQVGLQVGAVIRQYFAQEAAGLLRSLFAEVASDKQILQAEWTKLERAVASLGIQRSVLLEAIQQPAERFVEQSLADAKADGLVSTDEEAKLEWLLHTLITRDTFGSYVRGEIQRTRMLSSIREGRLPGVNCNLVGLRAGEIVHAQLEAMYTRTKQLQSGTRVDRFQGTLTITDDRLLFQSAELGLEVTHRRVLEIKLHPNCFEVLTSGRGSGLYLPADDAEVIVAIYQVAVRKANQSIVAPASGKSARSIPRDVRQRVWQAYAGRCAECGATEYLEFDHIIPVAKGGSNSQANVQLLCRRCNGKKSDHI
ncbi:MAG TPA: HNH endonuclease signature motif containing protein [Tepidisphaeraceae bacterium]|jgi:tellurite resistance protein